MVWTGLPTTNITILHCAPSSRGVTPNSPKTIFVNVDLLTMLTDKIYLQNLIIQILNNRPIPYVHKAIRVLLKNQKDEARRRLEAATDGFYMF